MGEKKEIIRRAPIVRWDDEEDALLKQAVKVLGKNWDLVARLVPGRTKSQCKVRYQLYIDEQVDQSPFTPEEDALLLKLVEDHGAGHWTRLTPHFRGRTWLALKNRYRVLLNRREGRRRGPQKKAQR